MDRKVLALTCQENEKDGFSDLKQELTTLLVSPVCQGHTCVCVLQKSNAIFNKLSSDGKKSLLTIIKICQEYLSQENRLQNLSEKYHINLAKILCHLIVAVLQYGDYILTHELSGILRHLLTLDCIKGDKKLAQSISSHVYKALWNSTVSKGKAADLSCIFKRRVDAICLAVSGYVTNPQKSAHQISVTMADAPGHMIELLRESVCTTVKSVMSVDTASDWMTVLIHLYTLFINIDSPQLHMDEVIPQSCPLRQLIQEIHGLAHKLVNRKSERNSQALLKSVDDFCRGCTNEMQLICLRNFFKPVIKTMSESVDEGYSQTEMIVLVQSEILIIRKLQSLVDSSSSSERMADLLRRERHSFSLLFDIFTLQLNTCAANDGLMRECLKNSHEFYQNIQKYLSNTQDVVKNLATMLSYIAHLYSQQTDSDLSLVVTLHSAALQFISGLDIQSTVQSIQKQLFDTCSKREDYVSALDSFKWRSLPGDEVAMAAMLSEWTRVKKLARLAGNNSVQHRYFGVEMLKDSGNTDQLVMLLIQEADCFSNKPDYSQEQLTCIEMAEDKALSPSQRAQACLSLVEHHMNLCNDISSAEEACARGCRLLSDSCIGQAIALKAQLMLWEFLISHRKLCELSNVESALTSTEPMTVPITYHAQLITVESNDKAMELLAQCGDFSLNTVKIYSLLRSVISIYKLSNRLTRALNMAELLISLTDHSSELCNATKLQTLSIMVDLGLTTRARQLLAALHISSAEEKKIAQSLAMISTRLVYLEGEPKRAIQELEDLLPNIDRTHLDGRHLKGTVHRILAQMALTSGVEISQGIAHHALASHCDQLSVFKHISTTPVKLFSSKIAYLEETLLTYIQLGKTYLHMGCVREVSCHLEAALKMAKCLHLPLRMAEIELLLTHLDCFTGNLSGAESRLHAANFTLTSTQQMILHNENVSRQTELDSTPEVKNHSRALPSTTKKNHLTKVKNANLFGFDSDDESFSLNGPANISSEDAEEEPIVTYGTDFSKDPTASPIFNRRGKITPNELAFTTHSTGCNCEQCSDVILHILLMQHSVMTSEWNIQSGKFEEAFFASMHCRSLAKILTLKFHTHFDKDSISTLPLIFTESSLMNTSCLLACYVELDRQTEASNELKSLQLIQSHPYSGNSYSIACAQVQYLCLLPSLLNRDQISTSSEELVNQLKSLDLDENTDSPLKPVQTQQLNIKPPSVKPPRKPRRAAVSRLKKMDFDSDEEDIENVEQLAPKKSTRSQTSKKQVLAQPTPKSTRVTNRIDTYGTATRPSRNTKVQVFCDDPSPPLKPVKSRRTKVTKTDTAEQMKPVNSARSSRTARPPGNEESKEDSLKPVRSTRRGRPAEVEAIRMAPVDEFTCTSHFTDVPIVKDLISPTEICSSEKGDNPSPMRPINWRQSSAVMNTASNVDTLNDDEMEILRGDGEEIKQHSSAELMRSSRPLTSLSLNSPVNPMRAGAPARECQPSPACPGIKPTDMISQLTDLWNRIHSYPPYRLYRHICQSLAMLHSARSENWEAAFYFSEASSITLRHRSEVINVERNMSASRNVSGETIPTRLVDMAFGKTVSEFKRAAQNLPTGWVVCSLTLVNLSDRKLPSLYLSRLEKDVEPLVTELKLFTDIQTMQSTFVSIMNESSDSMKLTEKSAWWKLRHNLNDQLKTLLVQMEKAFGIHRVALLGTYRDKKSASYIDACTTKVMGVLKKYNIPAQYSVIKALVNGADKLSANEISQYLRKNYEAMSASAGDAVSKVIKTGASVMMDKRHPTILILDKGLQQLCWESMPCVSDLHVTRMPSLYAIQSHLELFSNQPRSVYSRGIDPTKGFYVLNPDDNLKSTQALFQPLLKGMRTWSGVTGRHPTPEEYKDGLISSDVFLFIGHGSGAKFLKGRQLCQLECRAAVLLMGCSSGAMDMRGQMEPAGIMYDYCLSKCPCVLACLWDITDKDIDRYTQCLMNNWLNGSGSEELLDHLETARQACKLPYLIGSSAVVYGLPVHLIEK